VPVAAFFIKATPGNDIVNMGMIFELPSPGMENAEKTGAVTADKFFISRQFFQR